MNEQWIETRLRLLQEKKSAAGNNDYNGHHDAGILLPLAYH